MILFDHFRKVIRLVRVYTRDLDRHDAIRAASAMAFHAFFSLIPLVAISGWGIHQLTQTEDSFLHPLVSMAPGSVSRLADSEFMRLSGTGKTLLAPLSILGFLWLSSGGVSAAMRVFERIFEAPRRSWWRRRIMAFGIVLFGVVLLLLGAWIALLTAWGGSKIGALGAIAVPIVALWVLVGTFFRQATLRSEGKRRHGFKGAAVTLILWVVESFLFSYYVKESVGYTEFYGGLATVVILLAWLWLMSFSLLIGGEVNARIEGVRA